MKKTTVTFGELMLRLAPPGFERFLQSPRFQASFGGGEANVAVGLSQFGLPAKFITVLPQSNAIADAAVGELQRSVSILRKSSARRDAWVCTTSKPVRTSAHRK